MEVLGGGGRESPVKNGAGGGGGGGGQLDRCIMHRVHTSFVKCMKYDNNSPLQIHHIKMM
jgi:hypothetical protein